MRVIKITLSVKIYYIIDSSELHNIKPHRNTNILSIQMDSDYEIIFFNIHQMSNKFVLLLFCTIVCFLINDRFKRLLERDRWTL